MTTEALEVRVGRVLSIGSKVSTAFLFVGLVLVLADVAPSVSVVLINTGLILVLGTPVMRVLVSTIEFMRARDWQFVAMTLTVLCVLAGSMYAALQ